MDRDQLLNANVVLAAGAALAEAVKAGDGAVPYAIVPNDYSLESLEQYLPAPTTIKQSLTAETVESFAAYFNDFKGPESRVFASQEQGIVKGSLDYHGAPVTVAITGEGEPGSSMELEVQPSHCRHWIRYVPLKSIEWDRWTSADGKLVSQIDLAQFLEENLVDIVTPPGAEVLEVARELQAKRKVDFVSGQSLQDGGVRIEYVDETTEAKTKGGLDVPEFFKIGIPVYFDGPKYEVQVFLRWRIIDQKLKFMLQMHRRQLIEQDAFQDIVAKVASLTDKNVLHIKL